MHIIIGIGVLLLLVFTRIGRVIAAGGIVAAVITVMILRTVSPEVPPPAKIALTAPAKQHCDDLRAAIDRQQNVPEPLIRSPSNPFPEAAKLGELVLQLTTDCQ